MLKFQKVGDVKSPTRGTTRSAGIDFFIPNDFKFGLLQHGDSICISSGLKVKIPHGFCLVFFDKSSVASQRNIIVEAPVIDEDFQGEFSFVLRNNGQEAQVLKAGEKIIQGLLLPAIYTDFEVTTKDIHFEKSERGDGGFGHTGG